MIIFVGNASDLMGFLDEIARNPSLYGLVNGKRLYKN